MQHCSWYLGIRLAKNKFIYLFKFNSITYIYIIEASWQKKKKVMSSKNIQLSDSIYPVSQKINKLICKY